MTLPSEIQIVEGSDEVYDGIEREALRVYAKIVAREGMTNDMARAIWIAAKAITAGYPSPSGSAICTGWVRAALELLEESWPLLCSGEATGETIYASRGDLWAGLMLGEPMGHYGRIVADSVNALAETGHAPRILELGAGAGNVSCHLKLGNVVEYIKSDRNVFLLRRNDERTRIEYVDFDHQIPFDGIDVVFSSNSFHCSVDIGSLFDRVHKALRPTGCLIFSEGEPNTFPGSPWVLDPLYCQFRGWWNVGGFKEESRWLDALMAAGFSKIQHTKLVSGKGRHLGARFIAWK